MKYYIVKLYQNEKKKCPEFKEGGDRFEPKLKRKVVFWLIMMFVSCLEIIMTMIVFPTKSWSMIGLILYLISMLKILNIDNKDENNNIEKHVESHKKVIDILDHVLKTEFNIDTKAKVEKLISSYQEYINKKEEDEKKRNAIIVTILTALSGVLTISFSNMGLLGIDLATWIYFATILLILVSAACVWIYSYKFTESLRRNYEMMIDDLNDLLMLKY